MISISWCTTITADYLFDSFIHWLLYYLFICSFIHSIQTAFLPNKCINQKYLQNYRLHAERYGRNILLLLEKLAVLGNTVYEWPHGGVTCQKRATVTIISVTSSHLTALSNSFFRRPSKPITVTYSHPITYSEMQFRSVETPLISLPQ
jgi:hypothetical protein